jgi:hypothetical protein
MRADAQLFIHVLAATALFGATGAVAVLGFAARRRADRRPLAGAAFWTILLLVLPAWALTLAFGEWTRSKEHWPDDISWIGIGYAVADGGLILLLVTTAVAWWWTRHTEAGWPAPAIAALASLYLVALGVAWWVMTAKVPT